MIPRTKVKIGCITNSSVYKINTLISRGQTGPAREEVLKNLTPAQQMWLVKRPWEAKPGMFGMSGSVDIYVRAGKFLSVEEEVKAADLLFASMI